MIVPKSDTTLEVANRVRRDTSGASAVEALESSYHHVVAKIELFNSSLWQRKAQILSKHFIILYVCCIFYDSFIFLTQKVAVV